MMRNLANIDVIILCGGQGKRLRTVVNDRPKVLAQVNGRAFIEIVIEQLLSYSFKRIILSVGYKRQMIKKHFEKKRGTQSYSLIFSEEQTPLGTGGAVKKAESLVNSDSCLVLNGDSFCDVDYNELLKFHNLKKSFLTIVLAQVKSAKDYGTIQLDGNSKINNFSEKVDLDSEALVNAGIYLMRKELFLQMPVESVFSLEYDFFPNLNNQNCFGYITKERLFDIGSPERYKQAQKSFVKKLSCL